MSVRVFVLSGLLALSSTGYGSAAASVSSTSQADLPKDQVELIVDAKEYLARINNTLEMASRGEYGQLRRGSDVRLRAARDRIAKVLEGHATTAELEGDERVVLINAEEVIKSVIRNDDKSRIVCAYIPGTGSRLAKKECMSIAEREARAKEARRVASEHMRAVFEKGNQ
ncbi:MAG: hypothetical protein WC213_09530 [Arenimonas sp.]|jgi:hypothetical protein